MNSSIRKIESSSSSNRRQFDDDFKIQSINFNE